MGRTLIRVCREIAQESLACTSFEWLIISHDSQQVRILFHTVIVALTQLNSHRFSLFTSHTQTDTTIVHPGIYVSNSKPSARQHGRPRPNPRSKEFAFTHWSAGAQAYLSPPDHRYPAPLRLATRQRQRTVESPATSRPSGSD